MYELNLLLFILIVINMVTNYLLIYNYLSDLFLNQLRTIRCWSCSSPRRLGFHVTRLGTISVWPLRGRSRGRDCGLRLITQSPLAADIGTSYQSMQTVERKIVKRGRSKSYACAYGEKKTPRTSTSSTASSPSSPTSATSVNSNALNFVQYRPNQLTTPDTIDYTFKVSGLQS